MAEREGRRTREHLLSGRGLARIFAFVRDIKAIEPGPSLRNESSGDEDPAALITRHALDGDDDAARRALEIFIDIYGSQTGDLALGLIPRGGVYIAGGIAPRILPLLTDGRFIRAFSDKPPMHELLAALPVHIVTDTNVGLTGALHAARQLMTRRA